MGGRGSGRQGGRPTIEATQCYTLDVDFFTREFDGSAPVTRSWEPGDPDGELTVTIEPIGSQRHDGARAVLKFDIDQFSRNTGPQTQYVRLDWKSCRFGGRRWYWICPRKSVLASKLYLPNGGCHFWSRAAYDLGYQSQRETYFGRAQLRADRLLRKLAPNTDESSDYYLKPKGMHWRTFHAICDRLDAAQDVANTGLFNSLARILGSRG